MSLNLFIDPAVKAAKKSNFKAQNEKKKKSPFSDRLCISSAIHFHMFPVLDFLICPEVM